MCTRDSGVIAMFKTLGTINSLEAVKLNFARCHQITDEGLKAMENLKGNMNLKEIDLNFLG